VLHTPQWFKSVEGLTHMFAHLLKPTPQVFGIPPLPELPAFPDEPAAGVAGFPPSSPPPLQLADESNPTAKTQPIMMPMRMRGSLA
jgi:hypothetical protein